MGAHSAPRKKGSLALLVLAALALALAAWWFVAGRGEDTNSTDAASRGTQQNAQSDIGATTGETHNREATGTVETLEVFAPRDPFTSLVEEDDGGGSDVGDKGTSIELDDVTDSGASVDVNGTTYTVSQGEVFARSYQLLSVSGDCASLLYGDDQFTMCEGEEIFK